MFFGKLMTIMLTCFNMSFVCYQVFLCVAATVLVSLLASSLPGHSGGRAGKEGVLATTSLEFKYVHLKVEAKC